MISPDEALRRILRATPVLGVERVLLGSAVERVLAADLRARDNLPPFDTSAMDGYAVRARDLAGASAEAPLELKVGAVLRAGSPRNGGLKPGQAARIMTGAPLPKGADSVVMQEAVRAGSSGKILFRGKTGLGSHIRRRGEDVRAGARLLEKFTRLRPYEIALLAAQGIMEVPVFRRPVVAVLATGDELVPSSQKLSYGTIRNSNGPALLAGLSRWGVVGLDFGIVRDSPAALLAALKKALREADAVLMTGGVSVGDFDFTRGLFPEAGVREIFWKTAVKPGKPLLFGLWERPGRLPKPVFGVPGNPVAAVVCLEEFIRPALEKMQGLSPKHPSYHLIGTAANDYPKPKDRRQYLFCRVRRGPQGYGLEIIRPQGSAMLGMAARADALAVAPEGIARVRAGSELAFRWLK